MDTGADLSMHVVECEQKFNSRFAKVNEEHKNLGCRGVNAFQASGLKSYEYVFGPSDAGFLLQCMQLSVRVVWRVVFHRILTYGCLSFFLDVSCRTRNMPVPAYLL